MFLSLIIAFTRHYLQFLGWFNFWLLRWFNSPNFCSNISNNSLIN